MRFKATTVIKVWTAALWALGFCLTSAHAWQSDNGDGTFPNPPLYADYPDPDIIRVDGDFYFATTTFVNSPGLTILHSQDLVNWEIVSHVILRLDGREQYDLKNGSAYRSGIFAPSLRFHNGTFYVVTTPVNQNTRVYYSKNIAGCGVFMNWTARRLIRDCSSRPRARATSPLPAAGTATSRC